MKNNQKETIPSKLEYLMSLGEKYEETFGKINDISPTTIDDCVAIFSKMADTDGVLSQCRPSKELLLQYAEYIANPNTFDEWNYMRQIEQEKIIIDKEMSDMGWINVKERLPKVGGQYNVVVEEGCWCEGVCSEKNVDSFMFIAKQKIWIDSYCNVIINALGDVTTAQEDLRITYWKELPEIPKARERLF